MPRFLDGRLLLRMKDYSLPDADSSSRTILVVCPSLPSTRSSQATKVAVAADTALLLACHFPYSVNRQ